MRISISAVVVLTMATLFGSQASAEPYTVTIPGAGCTVSFDAPPLQALQGQTRGKDYGFRAKTDEVGLNLSIYAEDPRNKEEGIDAGYKYHLPELIRDPAIDQASMKVEKTPKYVKVSYEVTLDGAAYSSVNFYFAFEGRWLSAHLWRDKGKDSTELFAAFEKSLSHQTFKADAAKNTAKANEGSARR